LAASNIDNEKVLTEGTMGNLTKQIFGKSGSQATTVSKRILTHKINLSKGKSKQRTNNALESGKSTKA